ncbi:MAG TPA: hypothetical protein VET48_04900 [Steroidobacteraceae bacterium]|nr:hypothetical protein [Steroidobacteraceae bacterium]
MAYIRDATGVRLSGFDNPRSHRREGLPNLRPNTDYNDTLGYLAAASGTASGAAKGATAGAAIGSVIPVIGTVVGGAIGAVIGAITGSRGQLNARISAEAPLRMQIINQYKSIMGTVPGRAIGADNLIKIVWALTNQLGYPPLKADNSSTPASASAWQAAMNVAKAGLARGATSAADIYANEWAAYAAQNPSFSVWVNGMYVKPGNAQYQVFIDMIDAAMSQLQPFVATVPVQTVAPQMPGTATAGQLTTVQTVQPVPVVGVDTYNVPGQVIQNANVQSAAALNALAQLQVENQNLRAQLSQAQISGDSVGANQIAGQIQQLQQAQAQAAANYTQAMTASQPTSGLTPNQVAQLVHNELQNSGIDTSGAVAQGVQAASSPTLFGIPPVALWIGGGLAVYYFFFRRKRS